MSKTKCALVLKWLPVPLALSAAWALAGIANGDSCYECKSTTATCVGFDSYSCWDTGCNTCSSGCATIAGLAAVQCVAVNNGGFSICNPVNTPCGNFSTERISPCNWVCVCDAWTTYEAPCPGAFQTSCYVNSPCPTGPGPG